MKYTLFLLGLVLCFPACNNKDKYQGQWTNWFLKVNGYNETRNVVISNDSIVFNHHTFRNPIKYPLIIEKGLLKFDRFSFRVSVEKDTLTLNDSIYFVKDDLDTLNDSDYILKIDLPKMPKLTGNYKKGNYINYYVYYGKRLDNGKFSLQLNDKYAEPRDLSAFITAERASLRYEVVPYPSVDLFADKTTPMKFIEDIFYNLTIVNQLKVSFINDIQLNYNDSEGLYFEYNKLEKRLPPLMENDHYNTNTSIKDHSIPPPPQHLIRFLAILVLSQDLFT